MAWPLTAAITGFDGVQSRSIARPPSPRSATTISSNSFSGWRAPVVSGMSSPRSAPAQKAFSPAPVMMATRTSSSSSICCHAAHSRTRTSGLSELRASGRLSVTRAMWSCTATSTTAIGGLLRASERRASYQHRGRRRSSSRHPGRVVQRRAPSTATATARSIASSLTSITTCSPAVRWAMTASTQPAASP